MASSISQALSGGGGNITFYDMRAGLFLPSVRAGDADADARGNNPCDFSPSVTAAAAAASAAAALISPWSSASTSPSAGPHMIILHCFYV
jgi:hypothetical protein